jgi:hypothetical protein
MLYLSSYLNAVRATAITDEVTHNTNQYNYIRGSQGIPEGTKMTKKKKSAPYGHWKSDISVEDVTAGARSISSVRVCVSASLRNISISL